jgi:hypothetical protein
MAYCVQQRNAAAAAASKERNSQLLQQLEDAAQLDASGSAAANVQVCKAPIARCSCSKLHSSLVHPAHTATHFMQLSKTSADAGTTTADVCIQQGIQSIKHTCELLLCSQRTHQLQDISVRAAYHCRTTSCWRCYCCCFRCLQLCALRAAYHALVARSFPNWCESVAAQLEEDQAAQQ